MWDQAKIKKEQHYQQTTENQDKVVVGSRQRTADFNGSGGGEFLTPDLNNRWMLDRLMGSRACLTHVRR